MKRIIRIGILTIILFIVLYMPTIFALDNVITDEALKNNLINHGADSNNDGKISSDELLEVTHIYFMSDDELPENWSELNDYATNLKSIYFNNIQIENASFLEQINDLDLDELCFYNTGISDINGVENFVNLTKLVVANEVGSLDDISCIEELTNLEELDLSGNMIYDASVISGLTNLMIVNLDSNDLYEVPDLSEIIAFNDGTEDAVFSIKNNTGLSDINNFAGTSLRNLDITGTSVDDISVVSEMGNLVYFKSSNNEWLTDISSLNDVPTLVGCYVSGANIDTVSFYDLENLETVYCVSSNIYEAALTNLPNLRNVNFEDNELEIVPTIDNIGTNINVINLNYNHICEIYEFSNLEPSSVKTIYMFDNEVNPWDEDTFHIICMLKENNIDLQLGDCSRFDPGDEPDNPDDPDEPVEEDPENIVLDNVFRQYLINEGYDTDYNGKISISEIENVNGLYFNENTGLPGDFSPVKYINYLSSIRIQNINLYSLGFLEYFKDTTVSELWVNNAGLESVSGIEYLTTLTYLNINNNNVIDISPIRSLTNLVQFYAYKNKIQDASVVSSLIDLSYIDLSSNDLREVPDLSNLNKFKPDYVGYSYIYINENPNLADISGFANTNLNSLYVSGTSVSNISVAKQMPNLKYVTLISNKNLKDISILNEVPNLISISIQKCSVEEVDLNNLENLTSLNLSDNNISSIQLSNIPNLDAISLEKNNISQLPDFSSFANKIRYVNLNYNNISNISQLAVVRPAEGKSATIYMFGNEVNPWDEATFHVMCTLEEYRVNLQLGDCSRFEPGEEEESYLTEDAEVAVTTVVIDEEELDVLRIDSGNDTNKENLIENNFILPVGGRIEIVDKNGNIVEDGKKVGSRAVVTIYDSSNQAVASFTIAVKGDVTGNGKLELFDSFKILIGVLTDQSGNNLDAIERIIRDDNNDGVVALFDAFKFLIKAISGN